MVRWMILAALLVATSANAQMVRTAEPGTAPPSASIDALAWLAGSWTGEAMGGPVTETYSAPLGGRITGHFAAGDGKGGIKFTEIVDYVPVGTSIAYRVRHFASDMKGWEDSTGKPEIFPLIAVEGDRWYFGGMTLERTGPDAITLWVRIGEGDKARDMPFRLTRQRGR